MYTIQVRFESQIKKIYLPYHYLLFLLSPVLNPCLCISIWGERSICSLSLLFYFFLLLLLFQKSPRCLQRYKKTRIGFGFHIFMGVTVLGRVTRHFFASFQPPIRSLIGEYFFLIPWNMLHFCIQTFDPSQKLASKLKGLKISCSRVTRPRTIHSMAKSWPLFTESWTHY